MTTVYISSTYQDLEEYREAVYRTLRMINVDVRDTMEHAVARHERSLEACRKDVESCDIYVGIFAHRYGFVPQDDNPERQSITELEYRHARKSKKPCLIFLLDETVPWPPKFLDEHTRENERGDRIQSFRDYLEKEHTPTRFEDPSDLANQVQAALHPYLAGAEALRLKPTWPANQSPYPGLTYFTEEYAPVYFGREPQVREVLEQLAKPEATFVIVSGFSGSGKSSLVAAGVIPALAEKAALGPATWAVIRFVPGLDREGRNPFKSLAMKLFTQLPDEPPPDDLVTRWEQDTTKLREDLLKFIGVRKAQRCLLFMDQMEELFTLTDIAHHAAFIDALVRAACDPIRVIATVRSDFLDACEAQDPLHRILEARHHVPLWRVGESALMDMIREPARMAGLEVDPDLPVRLLEDSGREPGNLPLLAYGLKKLYDAGGGQALRIEDYEALGGIQGVVGYMAKTAFAKLSKDLGDEVDEALTRVFRELVAVDAEGEPTRQRAPLSLFAGDRSAQALIQRFSDKDTRLLVTGKEADGEAYLEVAHEKLFSSWDKLANWIGARRDESRLLAQAKVAGHEWRESHYAATRLWHPERILEARTALHRLEKNPDELAPDARTLIFPEDRLLAELENVETEHLRRAQIGDWLATVGDTRPGVGLRKDGLPDIDWVFIQEGRIELERGKGTFKVKAFQIARFPITWGQYRVFVKDPDGYAKHEWWDRLKREDQPGRQYFRYDNAPADNVSWYDAMAFCRWLTHRYHDEDLIPQDRVVRLPTEWEWQQAATGGNPERIYPWGLEWREGLANTYESGLSRTTAVGMYPKGTWPDGPLDLAGNVREWCLNKYDKPRETTPDVSYDWRVVRGGSWVDARGDARADDGGGSPGGRDGGDGFRVCCSSPID